MFIYLDESGTLTESDGKYFVIGTYTVGDPRKITKAFRKWQKTKFPIIQVSDWVCGALARYYEGKPSGEEFYSVLKGNIVQEKELFSEKWTKTWEE